jgi:hypothetical protein
MLNKELLHVTVRPLPTPDVRDPQLLIYIQFSEQWYQFQVSEIFLYHRTRVGM